jgi:peptide/nickel transport system substrate-binding protein
MPERTEADGGQAQSGLTEEGGLRMRTCRREWLLVVGVLCGALIPMWSAAKTDAQAPSGGTLVYARSTDSATLDPGESASADDKRVTYSIYDTLVDYVQSGDGKWSFVPLLAERWQTSPDGKTWTFHLRRGVKFHDGTDFDAEAVVFAFDRQRTPNHPYFPKRQKFWTQQFGDLITGVQAVDKYTVRFTLRTSFGPFLLNLAGSLGAIPSPTAVKKFGADFATNPVGTGPFKFVQWVTGDRIVLERFPGYWGRAPRVDRIVIRAVPDAAARFAEVQAGGVHIASDISPDFHDRARQNQQLSVLYRTALNVGFVYINIARRPFENVLVRRAVAHAIDKRAIVESFYAGTGMTAKNILPPSVFGHNDGVFEYAYDPQKARQLLAEAGFPSGFDTTLWVMPVSRGYFPKPKEAGEAIQSFLTAVGIRARIVSFDWTTYLAKTDAGEADLFMYGTTNVPDPHYFLCWFFCNTSSKDSYSGTEVQVLLREAAQRTNPELRARLYRRAQELLANDVPAVPVAHGRPIVVARRTVAGYAPSGVDNEDFRITTVSR